MFRPFKTVQYATKHYEKRLRPVKPFQPNLPHNVSRPMILPVLAAPTILVWRQVSLYSARLKHGLKAALRGIRHDLLFLFKHLEIFWLCVSL